MNRILFCIIFCVCTTSVVKARVRCYENGLGVQNCTGYLSNGEHVNLRSKTNALGTVQTTGKIGNKVVRTTSRTNPLGITKTTGTIDGTQVTFTTHKNTMRKTNRLVTKMRNTYATNR